MQANILVLFHTLNSCMGSKGQNIFSEGGHVAYQIKRKNVEHYASKMFDLMHPLTFLVG